MKPERFLSRRWMRNLALCALALPGVVLADVSTAMAQSQACGQIAAVLSSIERNQIYLSHGGVMQELSARQNAVRQAENQWINGGCQQALNAGQALSGSCQGLARTITLGRSQVEQLTDMAREGQSLAQNRQALLADYARNACGAAGGQRGTLLDDIFGGGAQPFDMPYEPWTAQQTRRTVCVRTCDGYYWPISFSTTDEHVAQDAIRCHEMCPGTNVALFSYLNPGQEVEDMISLAGTAYRSMPYAFRYRTEVDMNCSCQVREETVTTTANSSGQSGRPVIGMGEVNFPLPQPDPRARTEIAMAETIYVPLPRPRPREDGTAEATLVQDAQAGGSDLRIVAFGDRAVRVVGPETPFAPEAVEAP